MAIDLKALDKRIKKLQRLREFAKEFEGDEEFMELFAELIKKNVSKNTLELTTSQTRAGESESTRPRGYFMGAVLGVIAELKPEFTSKDIEKYFRAKKIEILAANPNVAINEALRTLEKRGQVVKTGEKIGGVTIVWRKSVPASAVEESRTA
jgi:hypothetical protein